MERDKTMKEVENKIRIASAKRKKKARDEIEKRKFELGIADKVVGVPTLALIYQGQSDDQGYESLPRQKKTKVIRWFDLNETEEDRDTKPIAELMKRYNRLWKNLFSKYQNAGFAAKKINATTFDTIQNSVQNLSIADISKILRDHDTLPQLVNKEEVGALVRLINMKIDTQSARTDLQSLTFNGFEQFIIQLALNCFSRPPKDLTGHSTYELLQALIDTFYTAVKSKNASTLLYEELSGNPNSKDKELIQSLTNKLQTEPDYPLPEGFSKTKELKTCVAYKVPEKTAQVLGEAHTVCLTVFDQLLNELFGFHFLESQVKVEEKWKVKPTFFKQTKAEEIKNPDLNNINPSNKVILKPIENERLSSQAQSQRLPPPLPKQFTSLINKQQKKRQPAFSVCAGILNQLINKAVNGEDQESNYFSNNSGALSHKSLNLKQQQQSVERKPLASIPKNKVEQQNQLKLQNQLKEQKRTEHDKKLKQDLQRLKEERKTKEEEEQVKKDEEEKEKKVQDKKKEAYRLAKLKEEREKLQKLKQEREDKKKAEKEEKERAEEEVAEEKMEERKEFFRKQKEELAEKFKKQSEQKQAISKKESDNEKLEREIKKKLKENMLKQSENAKKMTKKEEEMAKEMNQFFERPDIKKVFDLNEKGLSKYFKYFCKQAKNEGLDVDSNFCRENMHYKEFTKFAHQTKIVPTFCSAEDLASTFRNIVKYFKEKTSKDSEVKAGIDAFKSAHYIDFGLFKRALVRFALIACQTDNPQDKGSDLTISPEEHAQITDKVTLMLRKEFKKSNDDGDEEEFQEWLIDAESEFEKKTEQMRQDLRQSKVDLGKKRPVRAGLVIKQSFVDFELNQVTSEQLQSLFKFMGIAVNGDIDEKVLEDRAVIVDTQVARKNTLGRLNMKQQRLPEQLGVIKEGKSEDQTKPVLGKSPSKELDEDFQTDRECVEEAKQ